MIMEIHDFQGLQWLIWRPSVPVLLSTVQKNEDMRRLLLQITSS